MRPRPRMLRFAHPLRPPGHPCTHLQVSFFLSALPETGAAQSSSVAGGGAAPAAGGWSPPAFCRGKDCPEYEILQTRDDVELRRYKKGGRGRGKSVCVCVWVGRGGWVGGWGVGEEWRRVANNYQHLPSPDHPALVGIIIIIGTPCMTGRVLRR